LQPGHIELTVASLRNSLAGVAMAQRQPVVVVAPRGPSASAAAHVLCMPVALQETSSCGGSSRRSTSSSTGSEAAHGSSGPEPPSPYRPQYVGALMAGCASPGGFPPQEWHQLQQLAAAAAPYLLLLGLTKAADMADLLRLRAADCTCCSSEEDELQDLPLEACTPLLPPGGGGGGSAGAQAVAAAAAALAGQSSLEAAEIAAAASLPEAAAAGGSHARAAKHAAAAQGLQSSCEEEEGYGGDPKAAVKARQAAEAAAAAAAPLPPVPSGPLLRYRDPALEASFVAAHNRSLSRGDVLFALVHLAAALCLTLLHPGVLLGSAAVQAFVGMLVAPLLAMALDAAR
jgi:hypothetical protein